MTLLPGALVRTRGRAEPIGGFLTMWDGSRCSAGDEDLGSLRAPMVRVPGNAVGVLVGFEQMNESRLALVHYPQGLCMWWAEAFEPVGFPP